jgi:hypothetical protein
MDKFLSSSPTGGNSRRGNSPPSISQEMERSFYGSSFIMHTILSSGSSCFVVLCMGSYDRHTFDLHV